MVDEGGGIMKERKIWARGSRGTGGIGEGQFDPQPFIVRLFVGERMNPRGCLRIRYHAIVLGVIKLIFS
jgi:hypothetical protein